jgi:hypothetical protein
MSLSLSKNPRELVFALPIGCPEFALRRRANQWFMKRWPNYRKGTSLMSEQFNASSVLVEISKLNGSFKRNYGTFIGAYLYLRLISAARGRSCLWRSFWFALASIGVTWIEKHGLMLDK